MDKKIGIIEMLNSLGTEEGRKMHRDLIEKRLPEVLEKQRTEGFYGFEVTKGHEEYILNEYEDELK